MNIFVLNYVFFLLIAAKLYNYLPDYVMPYAIHLLAHDPAFKRYDDLPSLYKLKE